MQTMHRIGLSALAMPVALTLAGCGDKKEGKDKAASQPPAGLEASAIEKCVNGLR